MSLNPNFPQMEYAWGALWGANGGVVPNDRLVDITGRTYGAVATQRGRQYELDQVQSGTIRSSLSNADGALDPNNPSGPWAGNINPYQPLRVRAQWPPTVNILDPWIANGGDGSTPGPISGGGSSGQDVYTLGAGQVVASDSAFNGTNVFQVSVPAATAVGTSLCYTSKAAVNPGTTYSMTLHVRNTTDGTTLSVKPFIAWYGPPPPVAPTVNVYGATAALTGSSVGTGWTTLTVTATAPANPYGMAVGVAAATAPASACVIQVDGWQLEKSGVPSAFVSPGTWYPMYSGFVERWPQSWALNSTLGLVEPTGVDAFALLSQRLLRDPLTEEIYRRNPTFLYTLGDPSGVASFADATGNFPAAPIASSKYGAGALTSGVEVTSATPGGTYTGSSGSVVNITNPSAGTNLVGPASYISLSSAGINGPQTPSTWTRMVAFRYTGPTPTDKAAFWSTFDQQQPHASQMWWAVDSAGTFYIAIGGPTAATVKLRPLVNGAPANVCDGSWHLAGISMDTNTGRLLITIDGQTTLWINASPSNPVGCQSDALGNWIDPSSGGGSAWNFQGDLSFAVEFPTALNSVDFSTIYKAWKSSFSGDSTDQRYARVLSYAGYSGAAAVQTGVTRSMGPMVTDGQDALSALADVVITENGEHFVDRQGVVTFRSRAARYNATAPAYIFGENEAAGELPYEEVELDFDPTHLANLVEVTQTPSSQVFTGTDAVSQANFFPRTMQRNVNSSSALECQDAANYLVSRYKGPLSRVSMLKLHPSANPALWPACLSLELGTRVRIMRRSLGAPPIQLDVFVEQISWNVDNQGEAFVTLQCSPIDPQPYGEFAAWHSTLSTGVAAGVYAITVKASADNTNPLAAQIPVGAQLTLGQNSTTQETVTVLSVGATSSGWTSAVITLSAATTKAHAAGDIICEPLPSGITDPATYDTLAELDAIAFSY